jgi:hypothetical protein
MTEIKVRLGKWFVCWAGLVEELCHIVSFCYWTPRLYTRAVEYFLFKKEWKE